MTISTHLARLLLIAVALSLCAVAAPAQNISISGKVTDSSGSAVPNATVRVLNIASGAEAGAMTNGEGRYKVTGLLPGSYRVSATAIGFAVAAESLTLEDRATHDFTLSPGSLQDTVTVTAGKGGARVAVETPQIVSVTTPWRKPKRAQAYPPVR